MSVLQISKKSVRKSFGKTESAVALPDLIEVQSKSFNDFVQLDCLPEERENKGLESVLKNVFPIEHNNKISLQYCGYELGDWSCICGALTGIEKRYTWKAKNGKKTGVSRLSDEDIASGKASYVRCGKCHSRVSVKSPMSIDECKHSGKSYSMPVRLRLQLVTWDVDAQGERVVRDIKEQCVFLCSLPVMVDVYYDDADGKLKLGSKGTFLINGVARVVVSQVHRAAGVLFSQAKTQTKTSLVGVVHSAHIIPARGAWLDFSFDTSGQLFVRVDKKKKIPVTVFLQALGFGRDSLLSEFYPVRQIVAEKGKFYVLADDNLIGHRVDMEFSDALKKKHPFLKRGMRITKDNLAELKKAKVSKLEVHESDLANRFTSSSVTNPETGEVIAEAAHLLDADMLERFKGLKKVEIQVLAERGGVDLPVVAKTLQSDSIFAYEAAVKEFYSRIRPGDSPQFKVMEELVESIFSDSRFYDLTAVGRLRINRKLGLDLPLDQTTLSKNDILQVVKYLVRLQEKGEGEVDDVDHLSNRCVRLVDELLQSQVYLGFMRIEKIAKEKLRLMEGGTALMPYDFINVKPMAAVLGSFFGTGQLSQFMDQTNPLAELAHKRRLSALGPGGLTKERATLDVRDVHTSHYGRICPIATSDGHNIGLISYLSTYAKVNKFGFIEAVYRPVKKGVIQGSDKLEYLDAFDEKGKAVAQAALPVDAKGKITADKVLVRKDGNVLLADAKDVDYVDASTRQLVSVATALIPFLENDDANRALMGSNMQRQAVPLIAPKSPVVGTGVEKELGRAPGVSVLAKNPGVVTYVSSEQIIIDTTGTDKSLEAWAAAPIDTYNLTKFGKSSHNTWVHYTPTVKVGQVIVKGQVIADGPAVDNGELALGNNIAVAFMPWGGYNFEDAIVISQRLASEDLYTSVHIEEFVVEARDTKLGAEEITRDIPNVSERELENLDDEGIVRVGTRVTPGDILVAKATLKGDVQVSPEEKLLRAIFGEKSREVRDTSARVSPGINGTVVDVKVFSRSGIRKDKRYKEVVAKETLEIEKNFELHTNYLEKSFVSRLQAEVKGKSFVKEGMSFADACKAAKKAGDATAKGVVEEIEKLFNDRVKVLAAIKDEKIAGLRKGDDLPSGVIKMVRVYVAMKRPVSVGDKMAGRHGNKGVVSKVVPIEDMPYLKDGSPVDIVLNPLGVPGRMNLGQVLETNLGMACKKIGANLDEKLKKGSQAAVKSYLEKYLGKELVKQISKDSGEDALLSAAKMIAKEGMPMASPVFDGARLDKDIVPLLKDLDLPVSGEYDLYDGRSGEKLTQPVTVGWIYMMKLNHMADDKLHARSVGPYSLITQQPLGGKAKQGGQRLGEMEVWALFAYGAAYALQEMLTIKSDDVMGRGKAYEAIIHGEDIPDPSLPESFNVLIKELQSLCLNLDLFKSSEEHFGE